MLDRLTVDDFAPAVGDKFSFDAGEPGRFELELVEARPAESPGPGWEGRAPFNLLFRGPAEPVFGQQIFPLEHPELGRLEIFLVPVGRNEHGADYEAVFS